MLNPIQHTSNHGIDIIRRNAHIQTFFKLTYAKDVLMIKPRYSIAAQKVSICSLWSGLYSSWRWVFWDGGNLSDPKDLLWPDCVLKHFLAESAYPQVAPLIDAFLKSHGPWALRIDVSSTSWFKLPLLKLSMHQIAFMIVHTIRPTVIAACG